MANVNIHVNDKTLSIKENNHDNYTAIPAPGGLISPDAYTESLNPSDFTYTIQTNIYDGGLSPMPFSIENGGQIIVNDSTHLNIEERTQIHLLVEANDMNPNTVLRTTFKFNLYINILNVYETLQTTDISFNILESLPQGAVVGDISGSITFLDFSKTLSDIQYTIMSGNSGEIFNMDDAGVLTINKTNILDQDQFITINRDINVSVNGNIKYEINGVTMDDLTLVRGYTYKFIQNNVSNNGFPIAIATVASGIWADANSNYSNNVHYYLDHIEVTYNQYKANMINALDKYMIFSVPVNAPDTLYYYSTEQNDIAGTAKINISDKVKVNYSQYNMIVRMMDGNGPEDTTKYTGVDVYIEDVYDIPVVTNEFITVNEDRDNDYYIYDLKNSITSMDITKSESDHLSFTILSGNSGETFKIGPLGSLLLKNKDRINLEDQTNFPQYNLELQLNDGTTNTNFNLDISINNVYESLIVQDISFNVNDISPNGTHVGDISDCITFIDYSKKYSDIQYTLLSGNSGEAFDISSNGVITIKDKHLIDLDNPNNLKSFTLRVRLDDGITQKDTNIFMNISDVYDAIQVAETHIFNVPIDSISGDEIGLVDIVHRDGESFKLEGEIVNNNHTDFICVGTKIFANNDQIQNRYRAKQTITFTMRFTDYSPTDSSQDDSEITVNFICPNGKISTTIGDPYITPIYGNIFKLPSMNNFYRVFSNIDNSLIINCETFKVTNNEDNGIVKFSDDLMKKHGYNIDSKAFSLMDECFIKRAFIKKGNSMIIYNFENGIIEKIADNDKEFTLSSDDTIKYGMDSQIGIQSYNFEKNVYLNISIYDKHFRNVNIKLHQFMNKQIRSGITIEAQEQISMKNSYGYILCAQPIKNIQIGSLDSDEFIEKPLQISQNKTINELFIYNKQGYEVPIINIE